MRLSTKRTIGRLSAVVVLSGSLATVSSKPTRAQVAFETYGQAITGLLGIGIRRSSTPNANAPPTCGLTTQSTQTIDNTGAGVVAFHPVAGLSDRLNQHCTENNPALFGGASLGGSLLSSQPTRTVSQFITRRDRPVQSATQSGSQSFAPDGLTELLFGAPRENFGFQEAASGLTTSYAMNSSLSLTQDWPSGIVSLTNGQTSAFAAFSYEKREADSTTYQGGYDLGVKTVMLGTAIRISPQLVLGVNGYYGQSAGLVKGGGAIGDGPRGAIAANNSLRQGWFDELCQMPRNGQAKSKELGGSVFAMANLDGAFLNAEAGIAKLNNSNFRSLCLVDGSDFVNDLHRGIIHADVRGWRVDGKSPSG